MGWGWGHAEDNMKVLREGMRGDSPCIVFGDIRGALWRLAILGTGKRASVLSCTKQEPLGQPGPSTSRASRRWEGLTGVAMGWDTKNCNLWKPVPGAHHPGNAARWPGEEQHWPVATEDRCSLQRLEGARPAPGSSQLESSVRTV